ncbi:hypothetical protein SLS57_007581 [Botryosphaeria dothidea]
MGSVSASCPALPDIGDLSSLFPEHCRGSEYSIVHVYAGVTLLAFGAEKRIPELWQQIAQLYAQDEAAQATATRRLREGLVKASPLIGFPRAINALTALRTCIQQTSPPSVQSSLQSPAPPACHGLPCSLAKPAQRGQTLFDQTYGQHAQRVRQNLDYISGDVFGGFAVRCIYGELLAEERVLSAKESAGLVFVACLAAGAGPQAKG